RRSIRRAMIGAGCGDSGTMVIRSDRATHEQRQSEHRRRSLAAAHGALVSDAVADTAAGAGTWRERRVTSATMRSTDTNNPGLMRIPKSVANVMPAATAIP